MTSVRVRTCVAGAALAVLAGALVDHGAIFGADFLRVALLGIALGAVLGLVPHRSAVERVGGFAAGFVAAWLGYLLRAGVLPDIPMGRAIAAVIVISLITAVATATADRIPLWAGLLGAGALVGAYEAAYVATPSEVGSESAAAATAVLLAVAFGFVVTAVVSAFTAASSAAPVDAGGPAPEADDGSYRQTDDEVYRTSQDDDESYAPVPGPRDVNDVPTQSETNR
jgi:hypothetical protein